MAELASPAATFADLTERLAELATLENGWWDGSGLPMAAGSLETATRVLRLLAMNNIAMPGVSPNPEGFVQLEWVSTAETRTFREWKCLPDGRIEHYSHSFA
jgi:hypothetical protein